jgi:predicted 2-oxoglutarate/Fe(II)-dependent dioxygenase YbiX
MIDAARLRKSLGEPQTDTSLVAHWPDTVLPRTCASIIGAMNVENARSGTVLRGGIEVDAPEIRCCMEHEVGSRIRAEISGILERMKANILARFGHSTGQLDGPYFVSYSRGSFFRLHRDTANHVHDPIEIRNRFLSLVLFLNGREETAWTPGFDGGALVIWNPARPIVDNRHIVVPAPGLLIAFRSECLHEVMSVHEGVRYAAISWIYQS